MPEPSPDAPTLTISPSDAGQTPESDSSARTINRSVASTSSAADATGLYTQPTPPPASVTVGATLGD